MKKVAILYSGGRGRGGIETYLEQLFTNFNDKEIQLTLFSLGEWPLTEAISKMERDVQVFPKSRIGFGTVFSIVKKLKDNQYGLVVSNGNVSNAYARAASVISGVPSLVTVHSDLDFDYPNPLLRLIYKIVDRLTRFKTRRYLAVSKFIEDRLQNSGVSKDKIDVVYNAVELSKKLSNNKKATKDIVISTVGRLHRVKGFHNLIQAISLLEDKNIALRIGGEGPERENLEHLIAREGLKQRVELVGHVEPFNFVQKSDIYVQPSLSEGFGLATIDAMLVGVPVVVTPVGSLKEIVKDGVTGLVAGGQTPPALAAAIRLLIDSAQLREKLSKNAKIFATKSFTVEKWLAATTAAYRKALELEK